MLELLPPLFGTRGDGAAGPRHRPRRDGSDALQSALARRRDRRLLQRAVRRDVGEARDVATAFVSIASRRTGTQTSIPPTSSGCSRSTRRFAPSRMALRRHVDRRRERRRRRRARHARARRAAARRRRVVDRRHAVRVRRVGRGRRDHGVAEVPDVVAGALVRRAERARAGRPTRARGLPRSYWDFASIRRDVTKARPETPGTPPVHCVLQVAEALRMIHEEGLDAVFRRHAEMARDDAARRCRARPCSTSVRR